MGKIVQGDNGTVFGLTIKDGSNVVNLTGANVEVAFKRGSERFVKQAVVIDGDNGRCEVTLSAYDVRETGMYSFQATVKFANGSEFSSGIQRFTVSGKLGGIEVPPPPPVEEPTDPPPTSGESSVVFEDWTGGETVEIDTGVTQPPADTTAPVVTVTPNGGTFATSQSVTLTANESATIYYTLDGSTPTTASSVYSSGLSLTNTTTLKFFAKDTAGNTSAIQSVTFTKDVTAPADTSAPVITATPNGGTFTSAQSVTITANETATIYYTTDGSTPTTASTVYSGPINVSTSQTLKYFGRDVAGNLSVVQPAVFTINLPDTTPPVVTIAPNGGTFTTSQQITLSANEAAAIYYTVDGTTPTTVSTKYTAPFTVSATTTVKYFARDTAGNSSAVQSVTFTKQVETSPAGAILFQDDFNRVDGDLGNGWSVYSGANGTVTTGIVGNKATLTGGTWAGASNKFRRFTTQTINSNNFSLEVDTQSLPLNSGSGTIGIGIRVIGKDDNMIYLSKPHLTTATKYQIYKFPSGGSASLLATGTIVAGQNDKLKIEHLLDGTIKLYVNDVLDITITDTMGITSTTKVGFGMDNTQVYVDNFVVKQL